MKTALIIPIFNRSNYLKQCFDSLREAEFPADATIILINDASTDAETIKLFNEFHIDGVEIIRFINQQNKGIKYNLLKCYDFVFAMGCEVVMNLDSDAVVKKEFYTATVKSVQRWPAAIITAFHSTTKNADGSERHKIIEQSDGVALKVSVGGIHMSCTKEVYERDMKPALLGAGNWDHNTCINLTKHGIYIMCLCPSLIQHIGFSSSLNHNEEPDTAADFYNLELPTVTLFGIDSVNFAGLKKAADISQRDIKFADVILRDDAKVNSKEAYSLFVIKYLNELIKTDHVLVIQADGYVLDYRAWTNEFLNYDYGGATWGYKSGGNVGNGGFSLRSKKLLEILATDEHIKEFHPEDFHIGRTYRKYLEEKHGIKFMPEELANQFSIEAHGSYLFPDGNRYGGQFGFHGWNVDFSACGLPHTPTRPVAQVATMRNQPNQPLRNKYFYGGKQINQ